MAKRKLSRWSDVKPGDIISFKYNPKRKGELSKPHTVLVLNPRFPAKLKDNTKTFHLIGIKLGAGKDIRAPLTSGLVSQLERMGNFEITNLIDGLVKLQINKSFVVNEHVGVKQNVYNAIITGLVRKQYRTYDFLQAAKSAVFLEPIRVFTNIESETDED